MRDERLNKKRSKPGAFSVVIFSVILLMLISSSVYAEKICPVDGEVFPDSAVYCPRHGLKLISVSNHKIYVLTKDGNTEEMGFDGFNSACDGYGKEGIKYSDQGVTITIPWKDVKYILPELGFAMLKNGRSFRSEELKPGHCGKPLVTTMTTKTVDVLGYRKKVTQAIRIFANDITVISFSESGLEEGRKVFKIEKSMGVISSPEEKTTGGY